MADNTSELKLIISGQDTGAQLAFETVGKAAEMFAETISKIASRITEIGSSIGKFGEDIGKGVSTSNRELDTLSGTALQLSKSFSESTAQITKEIQALRTDFTSLNETITQTATKTEENSHKMAKSLDFAGLMITGDIIKGWGEKIVGFFGESVKAGVEFNQTLANMKAALDSQPGAIKATTDQMQVMEELALKIGETGFYSANAVGDAAATLARNGLKFNAITQGAIQQTAAVAAANQQDLDETATTVSDIYNEMGTAIVQQFGGNVANAFQYIGDVMTRTLHSSKISMTDLFNALKYSGSTASAAGVSFADLGGAISLLGSHAIRGSQSGTVLRRMLVSLTPSTKAATEMMKQLGFITTSGANVFYDASGKMKSLADIQQILHDGLAKLSPQMQTMALKTIFSTYALSGMSTIVNESPAAFRKLSDSMNTAGATMTALQDRQQGWAYTWMRLTAEFQTIEKQIGLMLKPVVDQLSNSLEGLMNWWDRLGNGTKAAIIWTAGLTGAFMLVGGAVLAALGTFGLLLGGLGTLGEMFVMTRGRIVTFATETIPQLITSLMAMRTAEEGLGGASIVSGLESIGNAIKAVTVTPLIASFGLLKTVMKAETWTSLASGFVGTFTGMGKSVRGAIDTMVIQGTMRLSVFSTFLKTLTLQKVAMGFTTGLLSMGSGLLNFGKTLGVFLTGPWGLLLVGVAAGVAALIQNWDKITAWVKNNFGTSIPQVVHNLRDDLGAAFRFMEQAVTVAFRGIEQIVSAVWNYVGPYIMAGVKAVSDWWNQHFQEIQTVTKVIFAALAGFVGTMLIPAFTVIEVALNVLSKTWHDIWGIILNTLKLVFDSIVMVVRVAWSLLSGIISVGLDILTGHWGKAWTDLKNMGMGIWSAIRDGIGAIAGDLKNIVIDAIKGLVDGVIGFFNGLLDTAQHIWNSIVGIFSQKVPSPQMPSVPDVSSKIASTVPKFAEGGIVRKPTLALVGEAGEEMIIPMRGLNQSPSNYTVGLGSGVGRSFTGGGNTVHIQNINVSVANGDAGKIAREIKKQMQIALA